MIKLTYKIIQILCIKRFLNKIEIPTIPPLLVNGTFETDFRKKAGIFNTFFADQSSILITENLQN